MFEIHLRLFFMAIKFIYQQDNLGLFYLLHCRIKYSYSFADLNF
jgi:hypothetical protein